MQKLLSADEQRRAKQRESPYVTWDPPLFETSIEHRRLRIISGLMRALDTMDVVVAVEDKEARKFIAQVANFGVSFTLEPVKRASNAKAKGEALTLRMMKLRGGEEPQKMWSDSEDRRLESHLADIVVAIVVHGERVCRSSAHSHREWFIKRKKEVLAEAHKKEQERLRRERERREHLEKARITRLLVQSENLRKAQDIRAYVRAVEELQAATPEPISEADLAAWRRWSLEQADRLDPVLNGAYRDVMSDEPSA